MNSISDVVSVARSETDRFRNGLQFDGRSIESAGEHGSPGDLSSLLVALLFAEDDDVLHKPGIVRTMYDPACGTGGMLSEAEEHLSKLNPQARLKVFGQELNGESCATCKASVLIRGQDADNIKHGNSFSEDGLPGLTADYLLCHPPFGMDWSNAEKVVRAEHEQLGYAGRFGPGLPRKSDSGLLFLLHMLSKMKPVDQGGGRLAIVLNGSPLFSGAAGSGESDIRRWIIENDWLEAIVALPDQMFYNTGISTYIWLVTNRKAQHRKGKVQLINGVDYSHSLRASVGNKRKELSDDPIQALVRLYTAFKVGPDVKVFDNSDFGYQRIVLSRPLQLSFQVCEERIARLAEERAWQRLLTTEPTADAAPAGDGAGRAPSQAVLAVLDAMDCTRVYKSRGAFEEALTAKASSQGVTIPGPVYKAILSALSEPDETAEIATKNGQPETDPEFRHVADIPLGMNAEDYVAKQLLPLFPNSRIESLQVGYSVKRIAHLGFELERELEGLRGQYGSCRLVPLEQVCKPITRRARPLGREALTPAGGPLGGVKALCSLHVEPDENVLLVEYLAMFLSTDVGHRLLAALATGSTVASIAPEDLGQLEVPVPTLAEQKGLLEARARIAELMKVLARLESELAANPANIASVGATVMPMLRVLGQVSQADEVRDLVRRGESKRLEFKESFSLDVRKKTKETYIEESALKNLVAFLNSEGGDLLVGVSDDGQFRGVEPELERFHAGTPDKLLLHVKNCIRDRIGEQFYPLIDQRLVTVAGVTVLWFRCATSNTPVFLDEKSFFVRTNPATDKLEGRKAHEYIQRRFGQGVQQ